MLSDDEITHLYKLSSDAIDACSKELHELSDAIWQKPELGFEEFEAHKNITGFLEKQGFDVQRKYILETAFRCDYGEGEPVVAIICEYDALPDIGHGCGHNLIAEAGVAASLGVRAALQQAGLHTGKLVILGTPAEETAGGKLDLIKGGVFNQIDAAMMIHPYPVTISRRLFLAIQRYIGKASHASGFPWEGINALDAAVMAYTNISCMRQQMKPTWRVHGIFVNGGAKPNIIPEEAELYYYLRAPTSKELEELKIKITSCFEGAATATGCQVEIKFEDRPAKEIIHNNTLCSLYEGHMADRGIPNTNLGVSGSSDMGNVSFEVPSIHPMFSVNTDIATHTRGFAEVAGDAKAQKPTLQHAKLMAMTAIDVLYRPEVLKKAKEEFMQDTERHTDSSI